MVFKSRNYYERCDNDGDHEPVESGGSEGSWQRRCESFRSLLVPSIRPWLEVLLPAISAGVFGRKAFTSICFASCGTHFEIDSESRVSVVWRIRKTQDGPVYLYCHDSSRP